MADSTKDVLERAAKKGLMKGTKRGKKSPVPVSKTTNDTEIFMDKKPEDIPEQLENLAIKHTDEKEPREKRSKSRRKKNEPKPFVFK